MTRRRTGVAILVLLAAALTASCSRAGAAASSTLACGLGLPPDAPGFAAEQESQARAVQQHGYRIVCDADLDRYRIAFAPLATATAHLAFEPVDLTATPLRQFASLGGQSETVSDVRSRLYRGFRTPEGHTVTLMEQDMSADGSFTARAPQDKPERIHGLPARLDVLQTPDGKAVSHLSWLERRRWYALWIDANVVGTPLRAQLFSLAASLPKSVPACPNETAPEPLRIGADGMPIVAPAPSSITLAELKALSDKTRRPCR